MVRDLINHFLTSPLLCYQHTLHSNVDRLTAIWQALNPDDWFTGESYPTQGASFVRYAGQLETTTTPLLPFMRPASDGSGAHVPWTSDDLRHVGELGYTYPELSRFGFGNGKGKDRSNGELAGLTRHLTEQLEWTTIGGTPPPVDTLFNSALFGRVDVFPKEITVDGEVKFVPRVIHADQKRPASGFGRWVRRTASWCRARLPFYTPPRYGHIRGLIHGGCLMDWNATFRVEK